MVTFKICTFVYLNVDYHHQEHFFVGEWIDSRFQYDTWRGVKVLNFWNVCPLKTLIFGRSKHLKNSSKILANTFSESLAILKPAGSLPVPITLSELWEWLFTFPSHNSLRKRTPLLIIDQICENDSFRKLFLFFENTFQYLGGMSQDISVSHFDSRRSLSSANRRQIIADSSAIYLADSFCQLYSALWSAWQEDPNDPQERCAMARTSCARLQEFNFCVRICYMGLISKCNVEETEI